jgi:predicted lipoprotein with Yx(FWY)xxD motif
LLVLVGLVAAVCVAGVITLVGVVMKNSPAGRTAGAAQSRGTTVMLTQDPAYGPILTNERGMTVYRFEPDIEEGVRDCLDDGGCTEIWPPLIVTGALTRPPEVKGQLTSRQRANGRTQAVYNGWPLYLYKEDEEPGDTFGDNTADEWGSWFVVTVDEPPPAPAPRR